MAREIKLFKSTLDSRYLNKEGGLTEKGTLPNCHFKDDEEIINPVVMLSSFNDNEVNYVYIPSLHRYYYVTGVTYSKPYYYVSLHVDVLMSFKADINKTEVIAERSKNKYDMFIQDDELIIDQYTCDRLIRFDNQPFSESTCKFILALLGS